MLGVLVVGTAEDTHSAGRHSTSRRYRLQQEGRQQTPLAYLTCVCAIPTAVAVI
jgi:hypothetical protein